MVETITTTFQSLSFSNPNFPSPQKPFISPISPSFFKLPTNHSTKCSTQFLTTKSQSSISPIKSTPSSSSSNTTFHGVCYVVGDNIDTDQIIPGEYLTLVPSNPEEYKNLVHTHLLGYQVHIQFAEDNEYQTKYSIIIVGDNFGCGSSREHAPVGLGAAGTGYCNNPLLLTASSPIYTLLVTASSSMTQNTRFTHISLLVTAFKYQT